MPEIYWVDVIKTFKVIGAESEDEAKTAAEHFDYHDTQMGDIRVKLTDMEIATFKDVY